MYVPALVVRNRWETDWTRRWFYHVSLVGDGLRSTRGLIHLTPSPEIVLTSLEEAHLLLLLNVAARLSTRNLEEEFCAFRVCLLRRVGVSLLGSPRMGFPPSKSASAKVWASVPFFCLFLFLIGIWLPL